MRVNRGLLGWGVFFVALGSVPLAVQLGVLDTATARQAWQLWPLLLVGIGLGLVLRSADLDIAGGLVIALTLGLMGGGFLAGGFGPGAPPFAICGVSGGTPSSGTSPIGGSLGASASVDLAVDCGTLTVSSQPGSDWSVSWPAGQADGPQAVVADSTQLRLEFGSNHGFGFGNPSSRWDVKLPVDPSTSLSLSVNAGSAKLALASAHLTTTSATVNAGSASLDLEGSVGVSSLSGTVNAGSLGITLPTPSGMLTGSLTANAGSVQICSPPGVPLRIEVGDQPLASNNFGQRGMSQAGNVWTRGSWDTATSRIDLSVSASLGSITLDPEGGCG